MTLALSTLALGFIAGWLGQRSRMCFIGGFRDYLLVRDTALIKGVAAFFLAAWCVLNLARLVFPDLPLASYPPLSLSLLSGAFAFISLAGGFALGLFATLSDACPFRHHVMAGQGRIDSLAFILGVTFGTILYYALIAYIPFA